MKKGIIISNIGIIFIGITYFGIEMYGFAKGVQEISEKQIEINKTELIVQNDQIGEESLTICKEQFENGIVFQTCLKKYNLFTLKSQNGDIVYKNDNNPAEYILTDFNGDGFIDIKLQFMTNASGVSELLVFDAELKSFKEIENFSNFPSSLKISGTNLFYSYRRSGCANGNWDSDLFYLKENKAIKIGNIHSVECDNDNDNGIYIFKVRGNNKKQIKLISIDEKSFENKWKFIENYWSENYRKFE